MADSELGLPAGSASLGRPAVSAGHIVDCVQSPGLASDPLLCKRASDELLTATASTYS